MYELSLTEHVMMSSDQRSSLWHPTNLLNSATQTAVRKSLSTTSCRLVVKIFQEDLLNFRRFPVFPGQTLNSSRFPVFPGFLGAVDNLFFRYGIYNVFGMHRLMDRPDYGTVFQW